MRTYRTRRFMKRLVFLFSIVALLIFMVACGTSAPLQGQSPQKLNLIEKGTLGGSDVYIASAPDKVVAGSAWTVTASIVLPAVTCPKSANTHYAISGWVGLQSTGRDFFQTVLGNIDCQGWQLVYEHFPSPGQYLDNEPALKAGDTVTLGVSFDGSNNYTFTFGFPEDPQSISVTLQGNAPLYAELGLECPKLQSGFSSSPQFSTMKLDNPTINGVPLNQWGTVKHYLTAQLKETQELGNQNSFTVAPAA